MTDNIEKGYHFYNQNEQEFDLKEYSADKRAAICFAAGVEAGKCELRKKVAREFKSSNIEWDNP